MIGECWTESPDKRPSFQGLCLAINSLLEGVAGYVDFSAFSKEATHAGAIGYDHLQSTKHGTGYDHLEPDVGHGTGHDNLEPGVGHGTGHDNLEPDVGHGTGCDHLEASHNTRVSEMSSRQDNAALNNQDSA